MNRAALKIALSLRGRALHLLLFRFEDLAIRYMVYIILCYMVFGFLFCGYVILHLYIGVSDRYIFVGRYIYY